LVEDAREKKMENIKLVKKIGQTIHFNFQFIYSKKNALTTFNKHKEQKQKENRILSRRAKVGLS
jgi:hypothetical protein